jgi:hypothetical protein
MYLMLECPKCGNTRAECECFVKKEDKNYEFWFHNCPDSGPTDTLMGEDCNWCDAKSPVDESNPNSVGYYGYNEKTDNYFPEVDE